jgi:hypothetical protein
MADYVDKTRTGIPGHPKLKGVTNSNAWGASAAVKRGYCKGTEVHNEPAKGTAPYGPQFRQDQRADRSTFNDVPNDWRRGNNAESRPGYAPSHRAPHGDKSGTRPRIRPGDPGPHR